MSFNMCISMLFLPFSHPEESLFTQSVSANGNGHQEGGGISHHGLLWPKIMRICLQAAIFIMLKLFPFLLINSCRSQFASVF